MNVPRLALLTVATGAALLVGCSNPPGPSDGAQPTRSAGPTEPAAPSEVLTGQLDGAWRRSAILLDDSHIAIVSDACAAAARETLGETEASLPTALVDARGAGV